MMQKNQGLNNILDIFTFDFFNHQDVQKTSFLPKDKYHNIIYRALLQNSRYKRTLITTGSIETDIYILGILGENQRLELDLQVILKHSKVKVNIHVVSLVFANHTNKLQVKVTMPSDIQNSECHLLEEVIIMSDEVNIKALPILDIHSNEIIVSHGAKVYKIPTEFLFYFQSRGFSLQQAQQLFLKSYFEYLWLGSTLSEQQKKEYISKIIFPIGYEIYF